MPPKESVSERFDRPFFSRLRRVGSEPPKITKKEREKHLNFATLKLYKSEGSAHILIHSSIALVRFNNQKILFSSEISQAKTWHQDL